MLTLQQFKSLDGERKKTALEMILLPLLGDNPANNELLEKIIVEPSSEELNEFYEVLIDPSKTQEYISKKQKEMRENNKALEHLYQLFQMKELKAKEYLANQHNEEETEKLLNQIS